MKKIVFCFLFFIAFAIFADDVVQGPFKIPGSDSFIVVKKVNKIIDGESYPYLNLDVINSNGEGYTLDEYEHEGGEPKIESAFFVKDKSEPSIYTIVSWLNIHRAERINATYYQVFSYDVDESGVYKLNTKISNDKQLRGFDGDVQGESVTFSYKTAGDVRRYVKDKYN